MAFGSHRTKHDWPNPQGASYADPYSSAHFSYREPASDDPAGVFIAPNNQLVLGGPRSGTVDRRGQTLVVLSSRVKTNRQKAKPRPGARKSGMAGKRAVTIGQITSRAAPYVSIAHRERDTRRIKAALGAGTCDSLCMFTRKFTSMGGLHKGPLLVCRPIAGA